MNDDLQSFIEPELEARIVALVLGEASAFEAGGLEKMIAEQAELQAFKARIEAVHGVVGEAHREVESDEWQLSGEKREKILSRYRKTAQAEVVEKRRERGAKRAQLNLVYACAACLMVSLILGGAFMSMGTVKNSAKLESAVKEQVSREEMLAQMDEQLIAQSDIVQDHRKDLTVLIQQYGIPYFDGNSNSLGATEQDMFRSARQNLADFETQRDQIEIQIKELVEKDDEDRVQYAAGLDLPENQVTHYFSKHREAVGKKRTLMAQGLSTEHPDVIAANERAKDSLEYARKETASLKTVLKTKRELINRQVERMSEMVDARQGDTVDLSLKQHAYTQAKETYEQSREMLREMKLARVHAGVGMERSVIPDRPVDKAAVSNALASLAAAVPKTKKAKISEDSAGGEAGFPVTSATPVEFLTDESSPAADGELYAILEESKSSDDLGLGWGAEVDSGNATAKAPSAKKPAAPTMSALVELEAAPEPESEFRFGMNGRDENESLKKGYRGRAKSKTRSAGAGDELQTKLSLDVTDGKAKLDSKDLSSIRTIEEAQKTAMGRPGSSDDISAIDVGTLVDGGSVGERGVERKSEEALHAGLEYLDDPIRTNPSWSFEDTKSIDKVRRKLYKGEGFYDLGLYDKADEEFKEILKIDPYNKAARRWMERTDRIKDSYYRASYDQTRAEMLMEVDREWNLAVPPLKEPESEGFQFLELPEALDVGARVMERFGERSILAKANQIIIPEVNFNNTTVEEALDFVRLRAIELDNTTLDETQKGVNLVLEDSALLGRVLPEIKLKDVPLRIILEKIGEAIGTSVAWTNFSIRFSKGKNSNIFEGSSGSVSDRKTVSKMNQIILPEIQITNSSMEDALKLLRLRAEVLDATSIDYDGRKGVEIEIDEPKLKREILERRKIGQLRLKNIPLRVAIEEVARMTGCKVRLDEGKVIFFTDPAKQRVNMTEGFETSTSEKSDSTFSLNVSDVSFKLAVAALAKGNWPDASKVRAEEFVNALDYDDSKPSQAEKVACEIEQGAHLFMPQRNLMRIAMSTASLGRNASTPLRLTILLDQSGSMERADRAESVKRAFALLAAQLTANDEVTLIGFARTPRLLAERVKGNEAAKLAEIIANPLTEGGTNLEAALASGLQLARQQFLAGAQNRIILLTDGAANLGDALPKNLAKHVASMRQLDIAFDACGVGADGLNDEVLSSLAKQGDGRYYFLDRPEDADAGFAKQIAGALRPAAKNVKVQILFNPERVSKFKLYGFEKHKLKKEDFRNDSVDAAEMAAEESGVALYHFEPLPEGRGDIGTVSVRFLDTATGQMVERTWAIPYEAEVSLFSESQPSLRLASVAGLFAEKLKGSVVGERVNLKRLRQETESLKSHFEKQPSFWLLKTMLQEAGQ